MKDLPTAAKIQSFAKTKSLRHFPAGYLSLTSQKSSSFNLALLPKIENRKQDLSSCFFLALYFYFLPLVDCVMHTKWHHSLSTEASFVSQVHVWVWNKKYHFLIMRLLACPICSNHFSPRGWKTQDAVKGKQKLNRDQYCIVKQEVWAIYFSLIRWCRRNTSNWH